MSGKRVHLLFRATNGKTINIEKGRHENPVSNKIFIRLTIIFIYLIFCSFFFFGSSLDIFPSCRGMEDVKVSRQ